MREQHRDSGKSTLAKAFRQEGVDGSEKILEATAKTLKQASLDDLYVAVATGILGPKDVVYAAYPALREARAPRMLPAFMGAGLTARSPRNPSPKTDTGMPLTGLVSGMDVHYAGCCHPLPGDKIVGIVATGKGVTVHTKDCATLETFAATPERFIDVDWDSTNINRAGDKGGFIGRVSVISNNSPAALAAIANAVAKQDGAIANLKVVHRQQDFFEALVDVEVKDVRHLGQVIAGLRGAAGIAQVERAKT
jgi:GTP pyrophosphokinase